MCRQTDNVRRRPLPWLAAGEPVARRAGYDAACAFVAAFRREAGSTPAGYLRSAPR